MNDVALDEAGPMVTEPPQWFTRAIAVAGQEGTVEVEGCPIHFVEWGARGRPGIVLVHGSSAHVHWWSFIAPLIAEDFHVVALDLSGNGDSGWREAYSGPLFAEEVRAVARAAEMAPRPYVVGHSFGGFVTISAAQLHGQDLAGIVLVDSAVRPPEGHERWTRRTDDGRHRRRPTGPTRVYEDLEAALSRFRLSPPQACENAYILDYVARRSLRAVEGGWTWKFDPRLFERLAMRFADPEGLGPLTCQMAVIRGEMSAVVSTEAVAAMHEILGEKVPVFAIPAARHHVMFDQPLAFVSALRALLHAWEADDQEASARRALEPA